MDLGLSGATVFVTGGTGGIGQGLVLGFAAEGANVICASRDLTAGSALERRATDGGLTGQVRAVQTDVSDRGSVQAAVATSHDIFGPIDVLINNAAVSTGPSTVADLDESARVAQVRTNIDGAVNCIQAVASDMLGRRHGSVINIGSNASLLGEAAQGCVHYAGCKGFLDSFSRGLAWEWAPHGVRVNVISPGWIVPHEDNHLSARSLWKTQFGDSGRAHALAERAATGTLPSIAVQPIPRVGRPEDVTALALFLASDLSSYITGQLVSVSGGAYMP